MKRLRQFPYAIYDKRNKTLVNSTATIHLKKKRMKKLIFSLLLLSLNQAFAQTYSSTNKKPIIDSILQSYTQPNEPGMAIGIVKDGKVIYKKSRGIADLSNNIPITDSTVFNIASVSKHFTALLALIAEDEGKISLEDEISQYLPELNHLPYKITIKQLANHSHGLPNYSDFSQMINFGLNAPLNNEQIVQVILRINTMNFKPGTQYQYGNTGFILLAEILKRVYDKPFPEIIKEKLFEPLSMTQSATIDNPNAIIKNKAIAYTKHKYKYEEYMDRQMSCGSSNIHTTLNDLVKWVVNFQEPKVGTQAQINRLTTKTISFSKDSDLGYGLGLISETSEGINTVFHGGGTAGYRAYIMHVPKQNLSIVTLGNQDNFNSLLIVNDLLKLYLGDFMVKNTPTQVTYSPDELNKFAGTYKFSPGQYWVIHTDGKNLYFGDSTRPLPIIGDRKFEFPLPTSYLTFHSNYMHVRIADFNYACKKINFTPPKPSNKELKNYIGLYKNEAFNVFFEFSIVNNNLTATHSLTNRKIILNPLSKHSFYADYPFGDFHFKLNQSGQACEFILDGQNYSNMKFIKIK